MRERGDIFKRNENGKEYQAITYELQCLITIAIKQAHILSSLPFLNNGKQFERTESTIRTTGFRTRKKIGLLFLQFNQNSNMNSFYVFCSENSRIQI